MKKIFVALSMLAFLAACDDSSSASAENSEPAALSSAEKQGSSSSGSVSSAGSETSSSSRCTGASEECDEAISSDSNAESNGSSRSSSFEKNAESSSSEKLSESSSSSAGKAKSSSSVVTLANPCKTETEDNCEYGELTDDRDGQTYKTVKIGDQWWMAENLNFETENSWCGGGSGMREGDCSVYGRLYTWAAAVDSIYLAEQGLICGYGVEPCDLVTKVCGICPKGWHLPSEVEFESLIEIVGGQSSAGEMLKSASGWNENFGENGNGIDAYGFSALPSGFRSDHGSFIYEGRTASFHSFFDWSVYLAKHMSMDYNDRGSKVLGHNKSYAYSIRCIKD